MSCIFRSCSDWGRDNKVALAVEDGENEGRQEYERQKSGLDLLPRRQFIGSSRSISSGVWCYLG